MQVVHEARDLRVRGDSGAALVEAAFITPVFLLVLFAVLEYGLVFRDYLTIGNGTTSGARVASIQGNQADADFKILQAVKKGTAASNRTQVKRVVIYKASNASAPVPTACTVMPPGSQNLGQQCNVYGPVTDWDETNPALYNCGVPGRAKGYCPTTRKVTATSPGPDFVGIYIEYEHQYVTGLFGSTVTIKDTTVTQLEPQKAA